MGDRRLALFSVLLLVLFLVVPVKSAYTAKQYIRDVQSGKQVACKWVKLSVDRHVRDLERAKAGDPDFPYYFDEAQAKRTIDFKQQLKHTQGEWANPALHDTHIRLEPWQQFIDWCVFGWRRKSDDCRRFTKAYVEVARKNGKTTDAAATANYCFFADRPKEIGPEIYCAATKRAQAKKAWDEANRQIRKHPLLKTLSRTYRQDSTIVIKGTAATMKTLGRDSDTEDSLNPHFALIDEYHAHKDDRMLEVLESGMGSRAQPLTFIITTAGLDKASPCYQKEHWYSEQVLEGTLSPVPESFFCIIFSLDAEDDWTDPDVWIKANPNLGISVSYRFMRERIQQALQIPSKQNQIITKNLNIWTQAETRWIPDETWMACNAPVDAEALLARPCYGGLDLSTRLDITAWVLCFPPLEPEEPYRFLYRFFMPEENILDRARRDRVPYDQWAEQGLVIATPGNVIDYDFIEQQIENDNEEYPIEELAYDPWKAQEIVNHLSSKYTMVPIRQNYGQMGPPTASFEEKVFGAKIAHGGNPVMRWMVSCAEVKSDRQDNIMPMKPRRQTSGKRIDGVVGSILSLGRAVLLEGDGGYFDVGAVYGKSS